MELKERRQSLENLLRQRLAQMEQLRQSLNRVATEIVEIRSKIQLLQELENEYAKKSKQKTRTPSNKA